MNINGSVLVGEDSCLEHINQFSPGVSSYQEISSNKTEYCKIEDINGTAVSKCLAIGAPLNIHEAASNYAAVTAQNEARRNELLSIFECRAEDQNMIASMRKAIAEFQPRGFVFFDFNLSTIYKNTLAKISIQTSHNTVLFSGLELLQGRATNFLKRYALAPDMFGLDETAERIGLLITNFVSNVLAASEAEDAEVTLRTHSPADHCVNECLSMFDWHVDKRFDERPTLLKESIENITKNPNSYRPELAFTLPLYGASTLFYQSALIPWNNWTALANESSYSYGCNATHYIDCRNLYALFTREQALSPVIGQGSIHIDGQKDGTVHACPPINDGRLLVIVRIGRLVEIQSAELFESFSIAELRREAEAEVAADADV